MIRYFNIRNSSGTITKSTLIVGEDDDNFLISSGHTLLQHEIYFWNQEKQHRHYIIYILVYFRDQQLYRSDVLFSLNDSL